MSSKNKWLEKAYEYFAEVGPDELNIKTLSEKADLPRTNFYYHFINKDDLIEQLLEIQYKEVEKYTAVLTEQMKVLLPDLHIVNMHFLVGVKFQAQLFLHRNNPKYNYTYIEVGKYTYPQIIPKLIEYYELNVPYDIAESLWATLSDTWYSRLDINQASVSYFCELTENIMKTIIDFTKSKQTVDSIQK